jgi:DNA-binding CsgD family transcriptional regulator/PAS domain-containing protein
MRGVNGADDILQIAERLYAAAMSPEQWQDALARTVKLFSGEHAILQSLGAAFGETQFAVSDGIDPRDLARAMTPEAMRLAAPLVRGIPVGVSTRAEAIPDYEFERSGFYNEILQPMNGFHSLNAHNVDATGGVFLSICRSRRAGNFDAAETAMLRALTPHLWTAIDLRRRLLVAEQRHESFARALDRLADGVILTDAFARILFVNTRASRIAAEADGLSLNGGSLASASPVVTRRLREAIAAVSRAAEGRRIAVPRPSHRPPLLLAVLPVWRLGIELAGAGTPRAAIFITEPDAPRTIDRSAVADIFRLTPRESEIAVLLAGGADLATIAVQLGLRLGTVRDHLKQVFEKCGARSQAALVALLRGFVDPAD